MARMSWPMTQPGVEVVVGVAGCGGLAPVIGGGGGAGIRGGGGGIRGGAGGRGVEDDDVREGGPEGASDPFVELVGDGAADVVGLDDGGEGGGCHGR